MFYRMEAVSLRKIYQKNGLKNVKEGPNVLFN